MPSLSLEGTYCVSDCRPVSRDPGSAYLLPLISKTKKLHIICDCMNMGIDQLRKHCVGHVSHLIYTVNSEIILCEIRRINGGENGGLVSHDLYSDDRSCRFYLNNFGSIQIVPHIW
jgi:hypothetical protein